MFSPRTLRILMIISGLLGLPDRALADDDPLDALYDRAALDLKAGRPLTITVHVALCDNRVISCGGGGHGNGDQPRRNLYWGGAAGFRAFFDLQRTWKRVYLDGGDGTAILERAVYRFKVPKPSRRWQHRGITRGFEVYLVGLAYRGTRIALAQTQFVRQVLGEEGSTLRLPDGTELAIGGRSHMVGYAGHNHLMDDPDFSFPSPTRNQHLAFFALSCMNARYLAKQLSGPSRHGVLYTRTFMYPGAFTIDGLARGLAEADPQHALFLRGVERYAHFQKRPERIIRTAFIHDAEKRFLKAFPKDK